MNRVYFHSRTRASCARAAQMPHLNIRSTSTSSLNVRSLLLSLSLSLLLAGCSEPFTVFTGGALSGEQSTAPDDWAALAEIETMQLETRPADPYSVNIWAVGIGSDLYVGTGPDGTRWSQYLQEDRQVRFRAEGKVYALHAQPVVEPEERRRVAEAYVEKYDLDSDENWVMEAQVFRLDRP